MGFPPCGKPHLRFHRRKAGGGENLSGRHLAGSLWLAWGLALLVAGPACGAPVRVGIVPVGVAGAAVPFDRALPYLFTDQRLVLPVETTAAAVVCEIRTITVAGWGPTWRGEVAVMDGKCEVAPLTEGLHLVQLLPPGPAPLVFRFLACGPPPALTAAQIGRQLPRQGGKLLAGQPYTILAMGDSVTATGDYAYMLAMLLARATGNGQIAVVKAAHAGRSVDATVREYDNEVGPSAADLGLLMYGLNDQGAFAPLEAYLEQCQYIVERLGKEGQADAILLEPTPHLEIAIYGRPEKLLDQPHHQAFRTIGFAQSLRELGERLGVPVAATFAAIWGQGGESIEAAAQNLWPLYPPHYNRRLESLIETDGFGDTIHPNALGHLQLAKAALAAIAGVARPESLRIAATSHWQADGVVSHLVVTNPTAARRVGRLLVQPLPDGVLEPQAPVDYDLAPQGSFELTVRWSQAGTPEDLLRHPLDRYLAAWPPQIPLVDMCNGRSAVLVATAPFQPSASFVRERSVVAGPAVPVRLRQGEQVETLTVEIPADREVGRLPLVRQVEIDGRTTWAVAELAYVRFAGALPGEAEVDGELDEWGDSRWSVLGEPCQARWTKGPQDHRGSPEECHLRWAVKAGETGLYLAFEASGELGRDSFTLYFDPRPAAELGTVGPYFWCSGNFAKPSIIGLKQGETTRGKVECRGQWNVRAGGASGELFIPYAIMNQSNWPAEGDLGFSLVWNHRGEDQPATWLMWAEDGHPWNTRWYGVIRKLTTPNAELPYRVRVK